LAFQPAKPKSGKKFLKSNERELAGIPETISDSPDELDLLQPHFQKCRRSFINSALESLIALQANEPRETFRRKFQERFDLLVFIST
jgi:hypothetical protein